MDSYTLIYAGLWDVLIEVAAALHHADGSVRRQWLIDAVEVSCVSIYPSTVCTSALLVELKIACFEQPVSYKLSLQ